MYVKHWLNRAPIVPAMYRKIKVRVSRGANDHELERLGATTHPRAKQIVEALVSIRNTAPQDDGEWVDRIEAQRRRLLGSKEPLVDASLGDGGLYDHGLTICDACKSSKLPRPSLLLLRLVRTTQPLRIIELGTNLGISSAYLAAALKLNEHDGRVRTLEASPYRLRVAKETHGRLGLDNISYVQGLFSETLDSSLREMGPVDLAFIDGHHQYAPTLDYFERILRCSAPDAIFIFDDIRWSPGMKKAWSEIQFDGRLCLVVDLSTIGVCVRGQAHESQRFVSGPMHLF